MTRDLVVSRLGLESATTTWHDFWEQRLLPISNGTVQLRFALRPCACSLYASSMPCLR